MYSWRGALDEICHQAALKHGGEGGGVNDGGAEGEALRGEESSRMTPCGSGRECCHRHAAGEIEAK